MSFRNSLEKKKLDDEAMHIESAPVVTEIESFRVLGLDPDDAEFFTNYSEADRKKTFRKVRTHYTPFI